MHPHVHHKTLIFVQIHIIHSIPAIHIHETNWPRLIRTPVCARPHRGTCSPDPTYHQGNVTHVTEPHMLPRRYKVIYKKGRSLQMYAMTSNSIEGTWWRLKLHHEVKSTWWLQKVWKVCHDVKNVWSYQKCQIHVHFLLISLPEYCNAGVSMFPCLCLYLCLMFPCLCLYLWLYVPVSVPVSVSVCSRVCAPGLCLYLCLYVYLCVPQSHLTP